MSDDPIVRSLQGLIENATDSFGTPVLELRAEKLPAVCAQLQFRFGFDLLLDITAIDYPLRTPRFDVVYHFYRREPGSRRVRLKVPVPQQQPRVPTLTAQYGSACFLEREVHDMYGIEFDGNADLRPILLYEGFAGHPLRKDYAMEREQPIVEYRR